MNAADRLVDGFPHGTPNGYVYGCRGNICPEKTTGHMSCSEARIRYAGDWTFRRRIDQGMTVAEIRDQEAADALVTAPKRPRVTQVKKPAARRHATVSTDGGWSLDREVHGTTTGYRYGCRLVERCPGLGTVGKSCSDAATEDRRARLIASGRVVRPRRKVDSAVALRMLRGGKSRKQIAVELGVSYQTVMRALKRVTS